MNRYEAATPWRTVATKLSTWALMRSGLAGPLDRVIWILEEKLKTDLDLVTLKIELDVLKDKNFFVL